MKSSGFILLSAGALVLYFLAKNSQASVTPNEALAESTKMAAADTSLFTSAPATTATQAYLNNTNFSSAADKLNTERISTGEMQAAYAQQLADMQANETTKTTQQTTAAIVTSAPIVTSGNAASGTTGTYRVDGQLIQANSISDAIDNSLKAQGLHFDKSRGGWVN